MTIKFWRQGWICLLSATVVCVLLEAKTVSEKSLHVSISVLEEAMLWQTRVVSGFIRLCHGCIKLPCRHDITIIKSVSSQWHHDMPLYDWYIINALRFCFGSLW